MNMIKARIESVMRFLALAVLSGLPLAIVYWIPPRIIEPTITIPTRPLKAFTNICRSLTIWLFCRQPLTALSVVSQALQPAVWAFVRLELAAQKSPAPLVEVIAFALASGAVLLGVGVGLGAPPTGEARAGAAKNTGVR